ncbi:MFS transporter [Saccharopolyspora sp. NPDC049426]|uniref:MFS transporter n=1 Tax=Saccharopolyspora sp. NPDC049426 TaxID=3155652 RepID=UPI003415D46C
MSREIAAPPASLLPPPQQKASGRVVATMTLARLGLMLALTAPLIAGLTLKVQTLVGPDQAVAVVGVVTTAGAVGALVFDPVFGRISDRTTGRFGRRRPWLVAGSLGLMLGLLVIAVAPNVWVLALGWLFGQIAGNAAVAAHTASLADQLPTAQRGKVGGLIGIAQQASTVGSAYAGKFLGQDMLLLFLVPGAIGLVLVLAFVLVLPDRPLPERPEPDVGLRAVLKTFWVSPRRHPDFAFAWVSRFLIVLAAWMFLTFRLLYLQHEMDMSAKEAASVMATGVLIYTVALVLAGQLAGWVSDRISRRKVFIGASAVIFGIGTWMLAHAESVTGFYAAEVVLGVGFGVYVAIDLALVLDVLPNPDEAGKDLGVFNIAMSLPQTLAPGLAAALVSAGAGQNYDLMLTVAAVIAVAGALAIVPVRSVR